MRFRVLIAGHSWLTLCPPLCCIYIESTCEWPHTILETVARVRCISDARTRKLSMVKEEPSEQSGRYIRVSPRGEVFSDLMLRPEERYWHDFQRMVSQLVM